MLEYEIYSPLPSNKTAQQNSQHCTKFYNKVHNVLYNKIIEKNDFFLSFDFVTLAENEGYILY